MVGIRSCVSCRKRKEKKELLRIVPDENNIAVIDEKQKINKRAIYICGNKECIDRYLKNLKKKNQNLKINASADSLVKLLESLNF
ncbi:MAG: YlxR family protein [Clostridia bacterium]|nr:YlxR family protein [Clostridia bacterium]